MSSSNKDFDVASFTSDASLLRDTKGAKPEKRSLLSRLVGSRPDKGGGPSKAAAPASAPLTDGKPSPADAVESLYRSFPAMATNTRLT